MVDTSNWKWDKEWRDAIKITYNFLDTISSEELLDIIEFATEDEEVKDIIQERYSVKYDDYLKSINRSDLISGRVFNFISTSEFDEYIQNRFNNIYLEEITKTYFRIRKEGV